MNESLARAIVGGRLEAVADGPLLTALSTSARAAREAAEALMTEAALWQRPLAELLPGIEALPGTGPTIVSTRCRNALVRQGVHSWAAVGSLTMEGFAAFPGVGITSLRSLLAGILADWARAVGSAPDGRARVDRAESPIAIVAPSAPPPWAAAIEGALAWLWQEQGITTLAAALDLLPRADLPPELADQVAAALALDLGSALGREEPGETAWQALLSCEDRTLTILTERHFTAQPTTLEVLGERFSVTRERIRQIAAKALAELEERWESDPRCLPLHHLAATVRRQLEGVRESAAVTAALAAAAGRTGSSADQLPLRTEVLRHFVGSRSERAGLSFSAAAAAVFDRAQAEIATLAAGELYPAERFDRLLEALGASARVAPRIEELLGLRRFQRGYLPWVGALNDKAVAILAVHGEVMSLTDLHRLIAPTSNPRSVTNAVLSDPRTMRRGRDRVGLRAWGGEEYSGILTELEQAITRSPEGFIDLGTVIPAFVREFGVSEASVRAYADDRRFVRSADGTLRMRGDGDPRRSFRRQPPEETAGLHLIGGIWHLRVVVDSELLRGSGRPIRAGVMLATGVEPDQARTFAYEGGPVTFTWRGRQPAIGSLRAIALAHGCREGDRLFIPLAGTEPRHSSVSRREHVTGGPVLERLAVEMGLDADARLPGIAMSLGLAAGAPWSAVVERLRVRNERDLIALVPDLWH